MLHIESAGKGPDLVLLHGWGMHSAVWSAWAERLSQRFRVHCVDLPGHGQSDVIGSGALDDWAGAVLETVGRPAWWLGWSLGGLVAIQAARLSPRAVHGLVLVASTPKFVAAPDWPDAVPGDVFAQFAEQLHANPTQTLLRFLSLQVRGAEQGAEALRVLRARLKGGSQARPEALSQGLALLQTADLRGMLADIDTPLHAVFGERDTLVPASLAGRLPGSHCCVAGAGHAPFLSHPEPCARQVERWILDAGGQYASA